VAPKCRYRRYAVRLLGLARMGDGVQSHDRITRVDRGRGDWRCSYGSDVGPSDARRQCENERPESGCGASMNVVSAHDAPLSKGSANGKEARIRADPTISARQPRVRTRSRTSEQVQGVDSAAARGDRGGEPAAGLPRDSYATVLPATHGWRGCSGSVVGRSASRDQAHSGRHIVPARSGCPAENLHSKHAVPRKRHGVSWGSVVALLALFFACGDPMVGQELECEEAVSHLAHCCSASRTSGISCIYEPGCDSGTNPDISQAQSTCLRNKTCSELVSEGVCASLLTPDAGAAVPPGPGTSGSGAGNPVLAGASRVCP
jgi:hypothetical protein